MTNKFVEVKNLKKKIIGSLTIPAIICLVVACFFGLASAADFAYNPVVTIAFDDGRSSQYQYAYPLMKQRGITGTFYIVSNLVKDISGNYKFMSFSEIFDLQNSGNEIGSHSHNHPSFTSLTEEKIRYECSESRNVLEAHGLTVENFAYPYGSTNDFVDSIVSEYYHSARTVYTSPYVMSLPTSQFRLTAFAGETGDSNALPRLKNEVDLLTANQWLILLFHSVEPNVSDEPHTISTQDFEEFLDYIVLKGIKTLTVGEALDLFSFSEPEPEPSTTNLLGNPSMEIDRDINGIPDGWNFYKTPNMLATYSWSSDSHTGTHSIKITSTYSPSTAQTESALWYQQISKIVVGETYRFKVWYQSNIQSTILLLTYSRSSIIEVKFLDLAPSTLWTHSGWLTTTIPSGAASLRVDCRLFNKDTGWVIFDDLELVSSTPPEPEPEPPTPETNLMLNPSVEFGNGQPDNWGFYKTSKMIATGSWVSDAHTGSKAVRIEATYNPNGGQTESALWYQHVQNYVEGETYKFRVWYKGNTPATIIMFARIGSTLATISILTLPASNAWAQSGWVSITVPKGSTFVQTDVRLMNEASGWAVFDDFELVTV